MKTTIGITIILAFSNVAMAHEGHSHAPSPQTSRKIVQLNTETPKQHLVAFQNAVETERPDLAKLFDPFNATVKFGLILNFSLLNPMVCRPIR